MNAAALSTGLQAYACGRTKEFGIMRRLIGAASLVYILAFAFVLAGPASSKTLATAASPDTGRGAPGHEGRTIFRYDTFGDEQLWTDVLRMHEVIQTVDPATALAVGLKVDVDALPPAVITALRTARST
jgi:hypothetical protein